MKPLRFFLPLAGLLALLAAGCARLPFAADDVASVEVYRYECVPAAAQKKHVTARGEIRKVYRKARSAYTLKSDAAGETVVSLRFHLEDGTRYEAIYATPSFDLLWGRLSDTAVPAKESELPVLPAPDA